MTQSTAHILTSSIAEQETRYSGSFRFPQFDAELKEVRLKYNLIEE